MACILLDIDGVLHVSGEPISGMREPFGPPSRRSRASIRHEQLDAAACTLAEELAAMGFDVEAEELQTSPGAAMRELAGKRVLALVMPAIVSGPRRTGAGRRPRGRCPDRRVRQDAPAEPGL